MVSRVRYEWDRFYSSPPRRRFRALRRMMAACRIPALYPRCPVVPTYWWDGHRNFGDALTPWLLPRFGILPVHRAPARSRLISVGSILEHLPEDYSGVVLGSGLMYDKTFPLPRADIRAVRGHLTAERLGRDSRGLALGDPGILVSRFITAVQRPGVLGIVPHGSHVGHPVIRALAVRHPGEVRVIDVTAPPRQAVEAIGSCSTVVSSSLHGLITADSFGIPALWVELDPPLYGGSFKFHDYESVISPDVDRRALVTADSTLDEVTDAARRADPHLVRSSQDALAVAISGAARDLQGLARSPLLAWLDLFDRGDRGTATASP